MIRRALSHLLDLTTLARTVHHLVRERDALALLAGQLEGELVAMTDTAEALRHELADRTTPRDAASPEAEVLRLAYRADRSWRDDVEAPALRRQLQAAEVELAAARAEVATVRRELDAERAVHLMTHNASQALSAYTDRRNERLDRLQRRLDRRGLTVARLVTALRRIRRVHAPGVLRIMVADLPIDAGPADSTQDQPPPTRPSERRPVEPAPERAVRVAVSS